MATRVSHRRREDVALPGWTHNRVFRQSLVSEELNVAVVAVVVPVRSAMILTRQDIARDLITASETTLWVTLGGTAGALQDAHPGDQ